MSNSDITIRFGEPEDLDSWMELVEKVKKNFPGLETKEAIDEHRETVSAFISGKSAICALAGKQVVGALLFLRENSMLCFLAVDPEFRRQHIAERMVTKMLSLIDPSKAVVVTTYREGVPEGSAARAFYKRLGFVEGELTEEFGSPVQVFTLKRIECMESGETETGE